MIIDVFASIDRQAQHNRHIVQNKIFDSRYSLTENKILTKHIEALTEQITKL